METKVVKLTLPDAPELFEAAEIIKRGGLVVFPTETVYGLGADALNAAAARKIYEAKGRPSDNPLIIHISDPSEAEKYTFTSPVYYKLAERFMPGPLTVIMRAKDIVPLQTRGGLPTVAVRCPENRIARALITLSSSPIAAPSANLSGSPSPTNVKHVIDDMMGRVDMIIDGGSSDFGLESTIVKLDEDGGLTLLRPGRITPEDLLSVSENLRIASAVTDALKEGETAISPGMKYRHYAPKAPLALLDGKIEDIIDFISEKAGQNIAILAYDEDVKIYEEALFGVKIYPMGSRLDEKAQAKRLFYLLREADKSSHDEIYAPLPQRSGIGLALYNRMIRASAHKIIKL